MTKFITKDEAVKLIKDKDFVAISGSGSTGSPEGLLNALNKLYTETSSPKGITVLSGITPGNLTDNSVGYNLLTPVGLVGRSICSHYGLPKLFQNAIVNNQFPAYGIPLGIFSKLLRAIASREVGFITKIGVDTFVDPKFDAARLNQKAKKDKFKLMDLYKIDNKEEVLLFKTFPIHVALIKATYADKDGNISFEHEPFIGEQPEICAAVKNSGGIVICEVEKVVASGKIKTKDITLHHSLIDYVVTNKPSKKYGDYNWPTYKAELNEKTNKKISLEPLELSAKKVCLRRALQEIKDGSILSLGVGMPSDLASIAMEAKMENKYITSVEMGPIGGVALNSYLYGASLNPECINTTAYNFDLYDGGYLDTAILGMGEVDKFGNVNVSKFTGKAPGPGGFINITQSTKNIIFIGTFTATDLKQEIKSKKLHIIEEGKNKKFVKQVEQITFSASRAIKENQNVLYITERAVFKLTKKGLELIEIAPGIDLKKDILEQMNFKPIIAKELKTMSSKLFTK